jgi:hypothetical protein
LKQRREVHLVTSTINRLLEKSEYDSDLNRSKFHRAMPAFFKMSDDKKTEDAPSVIFTETQAVAPPPRKTKKYVIIAVGGILTAVIILIAILVGMYMFTEAQKEIIEYTLKMSENMNQDVKSDPNENVVQYHIANPSQETWIINDFGKDIQVMKIKKDGKTDCYVSPLNKTNFLDPEKIKGPEESVDVKDAVTMTYRSSDTPISDTSFLGKTARETCKGVSIYWLFPHCIDKNSDKDANMTDLDRPRSKRSERTVRDMSPFYIYTEFDYYSNYNGQIVWVPCIAGCCRKICACQINYTYLFSGGVMYCNWVVNTCPGVPYVWDMCTYGPTGLTCPNRYPRQLPTC